MCSCCRCRTAVSALVCKDINRKCVEWNIAGCCWPRKTTTTTNKPHLQLQKKSTSSKLILFFLKKEISIFTNLVRISPPLFPITSPRFTSPPNFITCGVFFVVVLSLSNPLNSIRAAHNTHGYEVIHWSTVYLPKATPLKQDDSHYE